MPVRLLASIIVGFAALLVSGSLCAAGFQLQNQTGAGNGNAFAGAAAAAEDAGTVFFNPAGMMLLPPGHSFALAATVLDRSVKLSGASTSGLLPPPSTSSGRDGGGTVLIPAIYWSYAVDPATRIGLGISPTFGNETDYGFNFIGRYSGYRAEIRQINVNPSVAFRLTEQWTLGVGVNYAQNDTAFWQGSPLPTPLANNDVKLRGNDDAFGYNVGLLFVPQARTRLGLTYRSELRFRLDGDLDSRLTPATDARVRARLTTPAQASLAFAHGLTDRLELLGDLSWTGWSSVNRIDVIDKASGMLLNALNYHFRDTLRVGLGLNYQHNDRWRLRFGLAWDQTPVRSPVDRTLTLPDADRRWLAVGARWRLDKDNAIDIGYAHVSFADARIARDVKDAGGTVVQTIRGNIDSRADLLSVQWSRSFR